MNAKERENNKKRGDRTLIVRRDRRFEMQHGVFNEELLTARTKIPEIYREYDAKIGGQCRTIEVRKLMDPSHRETGGARQFEPRYRLSILRLASTFLPSLLSCSVFLRSSPPPH